MDIEFKGRKISFDKELSKLDGLALHFSERLSAAGIRHVVLSGYVAILFGRNRTSEDIDIVCETASYEKFGKFWKDVHRALECIITSDPRVAFDDYLQKKTAVRFAYRGEIIPNVEMKFATTDMHREAISAPVEVVVNGRRMPISPLEMQVAYKLFMGSEKDLEDARFLFKLFEESIDKRKLTACLGDLKVPMRTAKRYLGWSE